MGYIEVASTVARGAADFAIGNEKTSQQVKEIGGYDLKDLGEITAET